MYIYNIYNTIICIYIYYMYIYLYIIIYIYIYIFTNPTVAVEREKAGKAPRPGDAAALISSCVGF